LRKGAKGEVSVMGPCHRNSDRKKSQVIITYYFLSEREMQKGGGNKRKGERGLYQIWAQRL